MKWCFVPKCTITSGNSPDKVFIIVPSNLSRKKKWFAAARRELKDVSLKTKFYCCEDHFNLKEDMENYMEFKLSKVRARMKPEIVPHIFHCQPDKKIKSPRVTSLKRLKKKNISEILDQAAMETGEDIEPIPHPSTSYTYSEYTEISGTFKSDFSCQAHPVNYRSKAVQVSMPNIEKSSCLQNAATSPIKFTASTGADLKSHVLFPDSDGSDTSTGSSVQLDTEFSDESSETNSDIDSKHTEFRNIFIDKIEKKPRMYLGVPIENLHVVELLKNKTFTEKHFIYLTLYKIRTNDSFEKIGDFFNLSKAYVSKIFKRHVIVLSKLLKELITWPDKMSIKKNLPISFRVTFSKVQSIIDCLEIEIEKPSSAKQQALTWSEYKKCNTVKYLISSTPDGQINFVSSGYGGRISDVNLFENCGF